MPDYGTLVDVTAAALPQLVDGPNVLAVGVYDVPASRRTWCWCPGSR